LEITGDIDFELKDNDVTFTRSNDIKKIKPFMVLQVTFTNMILGVTDGYSNVLNLLE